MRLVLNELIYLLVRKKIITENEGSAIVAPDVSLKLSTFPQTCTQPNFEMP